MEAVVAVLVDVLLSGVFDILIEIGQRGFGRSLRPSRQAGPVASGVSALLLGALLGWAINAVWPSRVIAPGPIPGASLIITPLLNGLLMHEYGAWRRSRGNERFFLATFWGGALFAFGVSLVRLLAVRGS
jgi:AcrR family transcriptional regulator